MGRQKLKMNNYFYEHTFLSQACIALLSYFRFGAQTPVPRLLDPFHWFSTMWTTISAHWLVAFAFLLFCQCWKLEGILLLHWAWDESHRNSVCDTSNSLTRTMSCARQQFNIDFSWVSENNLYTTQYLVEFRIRGFHFTSHSSSPRDHITAWNDKRSVTSF